MRDISSIIVSFLTLTLQLCVRQVFPSYAVDPRAEGLLFVFRLSSQGGGPGPEGPHAGHVVRGGLPLGHRQGSQGAARGGVHPHPGAPLVLLRRHPRHDDHGLHRHEGGEQGHTAVGQ